MATSTFRKFGEWAQETIKGGIRKARAKERRKQLMKERRNRHIQEVLRKRHEAKVRVNRAINKMPGDTAAAYAGSGTRRTRRRKYSDLAGQVGGALRSAQSQANKANTRRYQGILGLYSGMGNAERTRIARNSRQQAAMLRQRLVSRGMGGSTIVGPMLNRVQETANLSYLDVAERVNRAKAGVMERVNDVGPSTGAYAQYLYRLGRARR